MDEFGNPGHHESDNSPSDAPMPLGDRLAAEFAARLVLSGHDEAAALLRESAEVELMYGDSWWDGLDDYVYDVHVTIVVPTEAESTLHAARSAVRKAIAETVDFHRDHSGNWRRGTLETVSVKSGEIDLGTGRKALRQADAERMVDAWRNAS
jgi:hypothetical protein